MTFEARPKQMFGDKHRKLTIDIRAVPSYPPRIWVCHRAGTAKVAVTKFFHPFLGEGRRCDGLDGLLH